MRADLDELVRIWEQWTHMDLLLRYALEQPVATVPYRVSCRTKYSNVSRC